MQIPQSLLQEKVTIRRSIRPDLRRTEFNIVSSQSYNLGYNVRLGINAAKQSGSLAVGAGNKTRQLERVAVLGSRAITINQ